MPRIVEANSRGLFLFNSMLISSGNCSDSVVLKAEYLSTYINFFRIEQLLDVAALSGRLSEQILLQNPAGDIEKLEMTYLIESGLPKKWVKFVPKCEGKTSAMIFELLIFKVKLFLEVIFFTFLLSFCNFVFCSLLEL